MKCGVRTNGGLAGKTTAARRGKESDKAASSPSPPAARGKRGSLVAAEQVYCGSAKLSGSASKSGGVQMRRIGMARPAAVDVAKQQLKVPSRGLPQVYCPCPRLGSGQLYGSSTHNLERDPSCTPIGNAPCALRLQSTWLISWFPTLRSKARARARAGRW
jgi:hypothetical protein